MELTKTIKVRKCSRNKLTKKQLKELRSHKFLLFERSWESILTRINITKAFCRQNSELHKYSLERLRKLHERAKEAVLNELELMGELERKEGYMVVLNQKQRRIKVSVEAE